MADVSVTPSKERVAMLNVPVSTAARVLEAPGAAGERVRQRALRVECGVERQAAAERRVQLVAVRRDLDAGTADAEGVGPAGSGDPGVVGVTVPRWDSVPVTSTTNAPLATSMTLVPDPLDLIGRSVPPGFATAAGGPSSASASTRPARATTSWREAPLEC